MFEDSANVRFEASDPDRESDAEPAHTKAPAGAVAFPDSVNLAPVELNLSNLHVVRFLNCTTNKPLHLGHYRNIALGAATAGTLESLGARVLRHCLLEDTGRFMTEAMAALRESSGWKARESRRPRRGTISSGLATGFSGNQHREQGNVGAPRTGRPGVYQLRGMR